MAKLIDLLNNVDEVTNDMVIYIASDEQLSENSNATTGPIKNLVEGEMPPEGMRYFLEVSIAKEVIKVWSEWRSGKTPMKTEKFQAILYYVEHDAYLPLNS